MATVFDGFFNWLNSGNNSSASNPNAKGGSTGGGSSGGGGGGGGGGAYVPAAPVSYNDSVTYPSGAGSGVTQPAYDPSDMAYLDDQEARLRAQQGSTDRALNNGITQLTDSYNKEVSGANQKRSQTIEDFNVKREDTTRGKDRALGSVDTNARTLANSLRLKLGMAGGADSSAYKLAAPAAVNKQATTQRTGVVENFGQNFRDLETGEKRAMSAFEELLADLDAQRKGRESDFKSGILDRKNQIDTSLSEIARQRALLKGGGYNQVKTAMAPYTSAIDARQGEIDSLFDRYRTPYAVKAIDVKTPSLRDYVVDRAQIGQQAPSDDPYSPYMQKKRQEEVA